MESEEEEEENEKDRERLKTLERRKYNDLMFQRIADMERMGVDMEALRKSKCLTICNQVEDLEDFVKPTK